MILPLKSMAQVCTVTDWEQKEGQALNPVEVTEMLKLPEAPAVTVTDEPLVALVITPSPDMLQL